MVVAIRGSRRDRYKHCRVFRSHKTLGTPWILSAIRAQQKIGGGVTPPPVKGRPLYLLELNGRSGWSWSMVVVDGRGR